MAAKGDDAPNIPTSELPKAFDAAKTLYEDSAHRKDDIAKLRTEHRLGNATFGNDELLFSGNGKVELLTQQGPVALYDPTDPTRAFRSIAEREIAEQIKNHNTFRLYADLQIIGRDFQPNATTEILSKATGIAKREGANNADQLVRLALDLTPANYTAPASADVAKPTTEDAAALKLETIFEHFKDKGLLDGSHLDDHRHVSTIYNEYDEKLRVEMVRLRHNNGQRWMVNLFDERGKVDSRGIVSINANGDITLEHQIGRGQQQATFASRRAFHTPTDGFLAEAHPPDLVARSTNVAPALEQAPIENAERVAPPENPLTKQEKLYAGKLKTVPPEQILATLVELHEVLKDKPDRESKLVQKTIDELNSDPNRSDPNRKVRLSADQSLVAELYAAHPNEAATKAAIEKIYVTSPNDANQELQAALAAVTKQDTEKGAFFKTMLDDVQAQAKRAQLKAALLNAEGESGQNGRLAAISSIHNAYPKDAEGKEAAHNFVLSVIKEVGDKERAGKIEFDENQYRSAEELTVAGTAADLYRRMRTLYDVDYRQNPKFADSSIQLAIEMSADNAPERANRIRALANLDQETSLLVRKVPKRDLADFKTYLTKVYEVFGNEANSVLGPLRSHYEDKLPPNVKSAFDEAGKAFDEASAREKRYDLFDAQVKAIVTTDTNNLKGTYEAIKAAFTNNTYGYAPLVIQRAEEIADGRNIPDKAQQIRDVYSLYEAAKGADPGKATEIAAQMQQLYGRAVTAELIKFATVDSKAPVKGALENVLGELVRSVEKTQPFAQALRETKELNSDFYTTIASAHSKFGLSVAEVTTTVKDVVSELQSSNVAVDQQRAKEINAVLNLYQWIQLTRNIERFTNNKQLPQEQVDLLFSRFNAQQPATQMSEAVSRARPSLDAALKDFTQLHLKNPEAPETAAQPDDPKIELANEIANWAKSNTEQNLYTILKSGQSQGLSDADLQAAIELAKKHLSTQAAALAQKGSSPQMAAQQIDSVYRLYTFIQSTSRDQTVASIPDDIRKAIAQSFFPDIQRIPRQEKIDRLTRVVNPIMDAATKDFKAFHPPAQVAANVPSARTAAIAPVAPLALVPGRQREFTLASLKAIDTPQPLGPEDRDGTNRTCGLAAFAAALKDFGLLTPGQTLSFIARARHQENTKIVVGGGLINGLTGLRDAAKERGLDAQIINFNGRSSKEMIAEMQKYISEGWGVIAHVQNLGMGYTQYRGSHAGHFIYVAGMTPPHEGSRPIVNDSAKGHSPEYAGGLDWSHVYLHETWDHLGAELNGVKGSTLPDGKTPNDGFVIIRLNSAVAQINLR
jgi:hypothetical protein